MLFDHRYYPAVHEAGHVTMGLHYGFAVRHAFIERAQVDGEQGLGVYVYGYTEFEPSSVPSLAHRGCRVSRADVRRCIAMALAGHASSVLFDATMRGSPEPWDHPDARGDLLHVERLFEHAVPVFPPKQRLREMRAAWGRATTILLARRAAVIAIAQLLIEAANKESAVRGDELRAYLEHCGEWNAADKTNPNRS